MIIDHRSTVTSAWDIFIYAQGFFSQIGNQQLYAFKYLHVLISKGVKGHLLQKLHSKIKFTVEDCVGRHLLWSFTWILAWGSSRNDWECVMWRESTMKRWYRLNSWFFEGYFSTGQCHSVPVLKWQWGNQEWDVRMCSWSCFDILPIFYWGGPRHLNDTAEE
jgi:hypothetical protein